MTDQVFKREVSGQVAGRDIINIGEINGGFYTGALNLHVAAKPKVKIVIQPGPDCIDEAQKTQLKALVAEVIRLEGLLKRVPRSFASVWVAVNAKCKASSYHLITQTNYPRAEKYLREWIGRLSSAKSAPAKDGNWRNRKYSYIFTNVRQLDAETALRAHLQARHATDSMRGLSDVDLDALYRLVAGWKKAGHAPGQASA